MVRPPTGTLRHVEIFKDLDEGARQSIEQSCAWRVFQTGEHIVEFQGDDSRDVFFLDSGRAKVIIYSLAGRAVSFRDIGPGDIFGEFAAIDDGPRSAGVEALGPCRVAYMSGASFRELLLREPKVMEAVLKHAVAQIRRLTARVFEFSTLGVNNRIHAELLRLVNAGDVDSTQASIRSFPTHLEIASRISTHREAVTRELTRLAQIGLVERHGPSTLVVKDIERLARMVEEASGE